MHRMSWILATLVALGVGARRCRPARKASANPDRGRDPCPPDMAGRGRFGPGRPPWCTPRPAPGQADQPLRVSEDNSSPGVPVCFPAMAATSNCPRSTSLAHSRSSFRAVAFLAVAKQRIDVHWREWAEGKVISFSLFAPWGWSPPSTFPPRPQAGEEASAGWSCSSPARKDDDSARYCVPPQDPSRSFPAAQTEACLTHVGSRLAARDCALLDPDQSLVDWPHGQRSWP